MKNNKFKLISRLKKLSEEIDTMDDLWDQWEIKAHIYLNNEDSKIDYWETHSFNDDIEEQCCLCSHYPIKELNLLENKITNERCIIGSCCIKKFGSKELNLEMKVKKGENNGHRYCEYCRKKLPAKLESWKTFHKRCYYLHRV